jgi:hypothetical protein
MQLFAWVGFIIDVSNRPSDLKVMSPLCASCFSGHPCSLLQCLINKRSNQTGTIGIGTNIRKSLGPVLIFGLASYLQVGIEDVDDLIHDLARAFDGAPKT